MCSGSGIIRITIPYRHAREHASMVRAISVDVTSMPIDLLYCFVVLVSGRNLGRPPSHPRKASAHTALDPLHLSHVENSTEPIPNISVPLHAQTNVQYQLSHQHAIYARPLSSGSGGWRVRGQASDDNIGIENRHEYTRPWSGRRVVGESDSDGGAATCRLAPHPGQNDVYVRPSSGGP